MAVFTDARGLTDDEMQMLTREMNFSECTFVLPPESAVAAKRIRVFTPGKELPMPGHPTVGTAYVLASRGDIPLADERTEAILQLGIGPTPVVIEHANGKPSFIWVKQRVPEFRAPSITRESVAQAIGLGTVDIVTDYPTQIVSTGVSFLFVPLVSLDAASRCRPNSFALLDLCQRLSVEGLYVFTTQATWPPAQLHARMFASPALGLTEDPATGSAAGPLGATSPGSGFCRVRRR